MHTRRTRERCSTQQRTGVHDEDERIQAEDKAKENPVGLEASARLSPRKAEAPAAHEVRAAASHASQFICICASSLGHQGDFFSVRVLARTALGF
ncbi:hypothetical protein MRX96_044358 [Rhipicephalus microplus]